MGHIKQELIDKARFVFNISSTKTITVNDLRFHYSVRLSRKELRALERAGYVKSLLVFGTRKFTDSTPTQSYVYEWCGPVNSEGRPTYDTK